MSYSSTIQTTGGTGALSFDIVSGALPPGLTLSQTTGEIYGYPIVGFNERHEFRVRVTDGAGHRTAENLIIYSDKMVTITSTVLPDATVGDSYEFRLQATGGTEPYRWEVTQGVLPDGLSMTDDGLISGTPTSDGSFQFNVALLDAIGPAPLTQTSTAGSIMLTVTDD